MGHSEKHTLYFKSTFVGTYIVVELSDGEIVVQSDNLSVITIIKDHLSTVANAKKITFEVQASIEDASWQRNLALLHPLILD